MYLLFFLNFLYTSEHLDYYSSLLYIHCIILLCKFYAEDDGVTFKRFKWRMSL